MNKAQILQLLQQPSLISTIDVKELEALVKQYPYFSVGQILLAKKYDIENHQSASIQLSKAALSANSREKLKDFMLDKSNQHEPIQKEVVNDFEELKTVKEETYEVEDQELKKLLEEIHERKNAFLATEISKPEINSKEEFAGEEVGALNEIAAASAEFISNEFVETENEEDEFVIVHDPEIESQNVIEEEFILHDLEIDLNENEVNKTSALEAPTQVEEENESLVDDEDLSFAEIISEHLIDEEVSRIEILNEDEIQRKEKEFVINETVNSPGEFLPDKSYSFTGWLKFFGMDKMKKEQPVSAEVLITKPVKEETIKPKEAERLFSQNMETELQAIDKIVSTIKIVTAPKEILAEELAK
ncbi:MAG: hypothetical protein LH473_08595, partial [Chitinophagales bacterium]|nr:hypothetical protein [Chitinophagales bacterium]